MALRIVTGFEFGTTAGWATGLTAARIISSVTGSPSIVSTGAVRSGSYALEISAAGAAERIVWDTNLIGSGVSRGRAVFAIRFVGSLPSADVTLATFGGQVAGIVFGFQNSSDRFTAQVEGGSVVTGPVVAADTWYVVELYYDGSSTSATLDWWVDGSAQTQATATIGGTETMVNFALGTADASTYTARYDDLVLYTDTAAISGPVGAQKVVLLKPDTGGSLDVSTINTAEWNTYAGATPTRSAWNATIALGAIDEVPVGLGAAADGFCRITGTDADYVGIPMTSYTLGTGETITGLRMLACCWAESGTACTHSFVSYNGTTATTLQAAADIGTDNSATAPAWVCKMCTAADFDTQGELDALQFRFGSTDSTPDAGIHAIYAELAVTEATTGAVELDGELDATADHDGDLTVTRPLAGTGDAVGDHDGDLAVTRPLAGASDAVADHDGELARGRPLAGASDAVGDLDAADLGVTRALSGASDAVSDFTGQLTVARPLTGASDAVGDHDGELAVARPLAGASDAVGDHDGELARSRPLAGALDAAAEFAGELQGGGELLLAGSLDAAADFIGQLAVTRRFTGTVEAVNEIPIGSVRVNRGLTGELDAAADLTGAPAVTRPLAGALDAVADLLGQLTVTGSEVGRPVNPFPPGRAVAPFSGGRVVGTFPPGRPVGDPPTSDHPTSDFPAGRPVRSFQEVPTP